MKKKGIEEVKNGKYFTLWDLIPYLLIAAIAVALLLVFHLPQKQNMTVFYVMHGDEKVMSYDFDAGELTVEEKYKDGVVTGGGENGFFVEIRTSDGFNRFFVDTANRTVKMTEADCSFTEDCTYLPAIENEGDSIICVPNKLRIVAGSEVSSPVTG